MFKSQQIEGYLTKKKFLAFLITLTCSRGVITHPCQNELIYAIKILKKSLGGNRTPAKFSMLN